jgi:calcineurin-like phosphoesterase family protein
VAHPGVRTMTVWFTADHHFGHTNIIRFCNRPFVDVAEMDEAMIERWNAVVGLRDQVWHLGDFAYRCSPNRVREIFGSLRGGTIHLVRGNHDRKTTLSLPWTSVQQYAEIVVGGRLVILFHYGLRTWNRAQHGSLSLYGHSHGGLPRTCASCDIGVDVWDFRPVSLDEIVSSLSSDGPGVPLYAPPTPDLPEPPLEPADDLDAAAQP